MRVIVCGGRKFDDYEKVWSFLDDYHRNTPITELIHGAAKGADLFADIWATKRQVPCVRCPADWKRYRNAAGPIRNNEMLSMQPDIVIAFPGSRGTAHMVQIALKAGVEVIEVS